MSTKSRWFATVEKTERADGQASEWKWVIVEDVTTTRVVGEIADYQFAPRDGFNATPELHVCIDQFYNFLRLIDGYADASKQPENFRTELHPDLVKTPVL
jgi:hypothetical protein